jgi:hypothetical protein
MSEDKTQMKDVIKISTEDLVRAGITYTVKTKVMGIGSNNNKESSISFTFLARGKPYKVHGLELKPFNGHDLAGMVILTKVNSHFNNGRIIEESHLDAFLQLAIHKGVTLHVPCDSVFFDDTFEELRPIGQYLEQQKALEEQKRTLEGWIEETSVSLSELVKENEES